MRLPTIQQPEDLMALVMRARSSFLVRCVLRFVTIQGFDRAIVISSQAFTALIPVFILVATFTPADGGNAISQAIIERFALSGESAAAVEQLFDSPPGATSSITLFSAMLLLYSGVAFTRRTQRMYRSAWRQEKRGLRSTVSATLGLMAILLGIALGSSVRSVAGTFQVDWLAMALVSLPLGMVLWTLIPYLLLDRVVHWRRLVVTGVAAAVAMTSLSIATPIYMPDLIVASANQFGLFGITIALIGWLLVTAVLLVGTASVGAEFDASDAYWALRAKARWRLLDPAQPRPVVPSGRDPRGLNVDDVRALIRVLANWLIMTGAVWVATVAVPGITVEGDALTYTAVALVLGLANAILGPTLSLVVGLSRWLGVTGVALVVNTLLLVLTAVMTAQLEIDSIGSAVLGGTVIAVTGTLLTVVVRPITNLVASTRDPEVPVPRDSPPALGDAPLVRGHHAVRRDTAVPADSRSEGPMTGAAYEIHALGEVPRDLLEDFAVVSLAVQPAGTTIHALLRDEAELGGLLEALERAGIVLVEVRREVFEDPENGVPLPPVEDA